MRSAHACAARRQFALVWPEAERDLFAARDWYEHRRLGLGDEFLDEVTLAMTELERAPELPRL